MTDNKRISALDVADVLLYFCSFHFIRKLFFNILNALEIYIATYFYVASLTINYIINHIILLCYHYIVLLNIDHISLILHKKTVILINEMVDIDSRKTRIVVYFISIFFYSTYVGTISHYLLKLTHKDDLKH